MQKPAARSLRLLTHCAGTLGLDPQDIVPAFAEVQSPQDIVPLDAGTSPQDIVPALGQRSTRWRG